MTKLTAPMTTDEKLDLIVHYLHKMDRRESWRSFWGSIRGLFALIPIILLVVSTWWMYENYDKLLQQMVEMTTKQIEAATKQQSTDAMDQLRNLLKGPQQ